MGNLAATWVKYTWPGNYRKHHPKTQKHPNTKHTKPKSTQTARYPNSKMNPSSKTRHAGPSTNSLGANVRNITPVRISCWKQFTSLEVLRGPQMTRKILLPVLQLAPRLFRGYYKNGLRDSTWKRGWGVKVLKTLLTVDKTKPNVRCCQKMFKHMSRKAW